MAPPEKQKEIDPEDVFIRPDPFTRDFLPDEEYRDDSESSETSEDQGEADDVPE